MKHFYPFSRTLMLAAILAVTVQAKAQIIGVTTVNNTGNCTNVVANFNTTDNGFNSPSIYYGNSSFYFNTARGWWSEVDGVSTVPPVPGGGGMRLVSIISPLYPNPNAPGTFDVGFFYVVPNPAVNRFQVRIISATPQGSFTVYNVEATTGFRPFVNFSSVAPTPYTGGASQVTGMQGSICIRLLDQDITNALNVGYRVEVTYEVAEPQFTVFDDLSIGGTIAPAPLPVTFLGVTPTKVDNGINVKWDVADEIDVQEYQLERSTDGRTFSTVATLAAQGKRVYSLLDGNPKQGNSYYRIRSKDIDGRTKYSGIVKVAGTSNSSNGIKVYPSPAQNQITIQHLPLGRSSKITISTIDGKVLRVVKPLVDATNTMVELHNLSKGMYMLSLDDGNGKINNTTFMKQ